MTRMRSKSAIEMALLSAGSLVGSMGETSVVVSSESLPNTLSSNCATAIMLPHLMRCSTTNFSTYFVDFGPKFAHFSFYLFAIHWAAIFLNYKTKEEEGGKKALPFLDAKAIENAI